MRLIFIANLLLILSACGGANSQSFDLSKTRKLQYTDKAGLNHTMLLNNQNQGDFLLVFHDSDGKIYQSTGKYTQINSDSFDVEIDSYPRKCSLTILNENQLNLDCKVTDQGLIYTAMYPI